MRLTRFSDIGLRVLIYLSRTDDNRVSVTVAEIATQFNIPINHLVKVVGHLARSGWVQATRGRNGGIRLCVAPESLRIGTVLRELEGNHELVDCEGQDCRLKLDCILRNALRSGMNTFYETMNRYTLSDIADGSTGDKIVHMHKTFLRKSGELEGALIIN